MVVFWRDRSLNQLTEAQWESLCDGCGKCCLQKLQDDEDDTVYYTDVACRYLDADTAQCLDYRQRLHNVPGCLNLTPEVLPDCYWWLPSTCAYRRLSEGKPLPSWHPLLTCDPNSVVQAGHSVRGRTVSEREVDEDLWQERVVQWVIEDE